MGAVTRSQTAAPPQQVTDVHCATALAVIQRGSRKRQAQKCRKPIDE